MLSQLRFKLQYLFKGMTVQYLTLGILTVTCHIFTGMVPLFWGTEQGTLLRIHLSKNYTLKEVDHQHYCSDYDGPLKEMV